jgi:hypothetical protein
LHCRDRAPVAVDHPRDAAGDTANVNLLDD